jgi:predicted outer membrane lipoprotein
MRERYFNNALLASAYEVINAVEHTGAVTTKQVATIL